MMSILLAVIFMNTSLATEDVYQKQKLQIQSVIKYLEVKCTQSDPEKLKSECPDPRALESYREQLKMVDSLIQKVEEPSSESVQIHDKKAAPVAPVVSDKKMDMSFCEYDTFPTALVGEVSAGVMPKKQWNEAILKNDLFTMDHRILEKDIEALALFKKDLSCKSDTDCELVMLSEAICRGGSAQIVISKNDRELETLKTQAKTISELARSLVEKAPAALMCPSSALEYQAKCVKCKCSLAVVEKSEVPAAP